LYSIEVYNYTLEEHEDPIYDFDGRYVEGNLVLTLRTRTGDIINFVREEN
jgi:hypothetical protein